MSTQAEREEKNRAHWQREIDAAIKEAIGELLIRRAKRIVQSTDRFLFINIDDDDLDHVIADVLEKLELEGGTDQLDMREVETVGALAQRMTETFIPKAGAKS